MKIINKFFYWIKSGCHFKIGWEIKEENGLYFAKFINFKFYLCGFGWQKYDNFFMLELGVLEILAGKQMFLKDPKSKKGVFFEF